MKSIFIFLIALCVHPMWGQNREWHVKPYTDNYAIIGDGLSVATAWSLQYALSGGLNGNQVQPGDIIWLHGGDYKGHFESTAALNGTLTNYTKVMSYPGEWARIDGNIHPYVVPSANATNSTTDPNQIPLTVYQELATNLDESPTNNVILSIKSKFVRYENFEVTCLGPINRLSVRHNNDLQNCELNGFNQITGINEDPAETARTKNRYVNIVIRNIAGHGMGSWKFSDDSEIYGCVLYNNGYLLRLKTGDCSSSGYSIIGRGGGIYTQNASSSTTVQRLIRNNIFMNNYDSGVLVWSTAELPTFDFVKNYTISKNIFINNGGPQRDESPNLLISSFSQNNNNHPSNINLDNNIFYFNSRSSNYSGIILLNTEGVTMHHNFIYKGTAGVCFNGDYASFNNSNINFNNNFYWGKRLQILSTPSNYLTRNWQLSNNKYYCQPGSEIYEVKTSPALRYDFPTFRSLYNNTELGSEQFAATYENDGTEYLTASSLPPKITITQNEYDSNRFYVTIFNPNAKSATTDNIAVNFSAYNITSGTTFKIRDPQNYFGATISGTYNNGVTTNTITFPMTLSAFEMPIGIPNTDYQLFPIALGNATGSPAHTPKDMGVFIVEFGCSNIPYDINRNSSETGTQNHKAKNNVFFNSGYATEVNSIIDARASKSIVLKSNTHIKANSKFLGKIEVTCPDLNFVGEQGNFNRNEISEISNEDIKKEKPSFAVYPNPSSGIFNIESSKENPITKVQISQINTGKVIFEQEYDHSGKVEINIVKEPKGLYIAKVFFDDGISEVKTIIKK